MALLIVHKTTIIGYNFIILLKYNYSHDMNFYYKDKFDAQGMMGLVDKKSGFRKPSKRIENADQRIIELRFKHPHMNIYEIAHRIKQEGFDISSRSIARKLQEHGPCLKKRKESARAKFPR